MYKSLIPILLISILSLSAEKPAYKIFSKTGKPVQYSDMIADILTTDYFFFGELHNNAIAHWLELEITKDIFKTNNKIILGAEMFESDNQIIINEYLDNFISENKFENDMRLWPNYKTDYKPLMSFAYQNKLPFIATNIPRRYASLVSHKNLPALENLSLEAKKFIVPLPINYDVNIPCYKSISEHNPFMKSKGMGMSGMKKHLYIAEAQAIKDATMAYNIAQNSKKDYLFIHFNGSYHSDNFSAIIWHLKKYKKDIQFKTLTTVTQDNIDELDSQYLNKADYILVVPSSMTTTY